MYIALIGETTSPVGRMWLGNNVYCVAINVYCAAVPRSAHLLSARGRIFPAYAMRQ
jgi:hypothetical protein